MTVSLPDFLLARIAEDEAAARDAAGGGRWRYSNGDSVGAWTLYDEHWNIATLTTYDTESYNYAERMPRFRSPGYVDPDANGEHIARHDPARVLAECEAKRRIVERLVRAADVAWSGSYAVRDDAHDSLCDLALPYADHPDYREEWRP